MFRETQADRAARITSSSVTRNRIGDIRQPWRTPDEEWNESDNSLLCFTLHFKPTYWARILLLLSFLDPDRDIGLLLFGGSIYYPRLCWCFACNVVLGGSIDCRSKSPKGAVWHMGTSLVASSKSITWPRDSGRNSRSLWVQTLHACWSAGGILFPSYYPYMKGLPLSATQGVVF